MSTIDEVRERLQFVIADPEADVSMMLADDIRALLEDHAQLQAAFSQLVAEITGRERGS